MFIGAAYITKRIAYRFLRPVQVKVPPGLTVSVENLGLGNLRSQFLRQDLDQADKIEKRKVTSAPNRWSGPLGANPRPAMGFICEWDSEPGH